MLVKSYKFHSEKDKEEALVDWKLSDDEVFFFPENGMEVKVISKSACEKHLGGIIYLQWELQSQGVDAEMRTTTHTWDCNCGWQYREDVHELLVNGVVVHTYVQTWNNHVCDCGNR